MKTYADGIWRAINMLVDEKKLNRIDARIALRALRAEAEAAEPTPAKPCLHSYAVLDNVIGRVCRHCGEPFEPTPAKPGCLGSTENGRWMNSDDECECPFCMGVGREKLFAKLQTLAKPVEQAVCEPFCGTICDNQAVWWCSPVCHNLGRPANPAKRTP